MNTPDSPEFLAQHTQRDTAMLSTWETLSQRLDSFQQAVQDHWMLAFESFLRRHKALNKQACEILDQQLEQPFDYKVLLTATEALTAEYMTLIGEVPGLIAAGEEQPAWESWSQTFQECLKEQSNRFTVKISKKALQKESEDSRIQSIWKHLQRQRLWAWEKQVLLQNKYLTFRKKKTLPVPRFKRQVQLTDYLDHQLGVSIDEDLHRLWNEYQLLLARLIKQLHEETEHRLYDLLLLDLFPQVFHKSRVNEVRKRLQEIRAWSPDYDTIDQELAAFRSHIKDTLRASYEQAGNQIKASWPYVGTLVYPNLLHHPPRIRFRRKRLLSRTLSRRQAWTRFLNGEKHEWLKDMELAILQSRLPAAVVDTLRGIQEQVNKNILPSFAEPHRIITEARKRFEEEGSLGEKGLKRDILAQNRSLLRDLRREMLPRILESLQQARLSDRLQNLIMRSRHLMEQLPDSYTILRFQRISGGRPLTRFIDIDLKALVKAEAFSAYEAGLNHFDRELIQRGDKLSRDVTEIDQIIEFNLGAALDLLSGGGDKTAAKTPVEVVVAGLERAKNQLGNLIEESQGIIASSQQTIPDLVQKADQSIQKLVVSEKIIELQLKLKRARLVERLLIIWEQTLDLLRSIWPRLKGRLTQAIDALVDLYRRVRKITGLAVIPADIQQQLHRYLVQTQKQVESLPYVYRRLFRFEPISDERFFIGRSRELKLFEEYFTEFKSGHGVSICLIGESGSGRTSLLNMVQSRILVAYPSYRMQLEQTCLEEEQVVKLLSEGLRLDVKTGFEDLTAAMQEMRNRPVVILENIIHAGNSYSNPNSNNYERNNTR